MKKSNPFIPLLALVLVSACGAGDAADETDVTLLDTQGDAPSADAREVSQPVATDSADAPESLMSTDPAVIEKTICIACDNACIRTSPPNCGWGCCYCNGVKGYFSQAPWNANTWLCLH